MKQRLSFKRPFKLLPVLPIPRALARLRTGSLSLRLVMTGLTAAPAALASDIRPVLMLPNLYHPGVGLHDYWVSEKYDGVRGYWDGEKLLTRGGQRINAPAWFTSGWPTTPFDGELWAGRGQFPQAPRTRRRTRLARSALSVARVPQRRALPRRMRARCAAWSPRALAGPRNQRRKGPG